MISFGVDIGGTQTRVGRFADLAQPAFDQLARYPTPQSYAEQLTRLGAVIGAAAGAGVGVSLGAQLLPDGSGVRAAPNLPGYEGRPFAADLAARVGVPVRLAHDPVCGALAEARFGALAGERRAAYLTLSTGTGAALLLADRAVSIQFGHQILAGNTLPCLCGQVGCLETRTGGRQLRDRLGVPLETLTDAAFWSDYADALALGLVNLAQLTRVEVVAVSGGIATAHPELVPATQARIDQWFTGGRLRLAPAALGEDAPLVGAALLLDDPPPILH